MMDVSVEVWLWLGLVVTTVYYIWVGRVFISQPQFNQPRIFWNPAVAMILANLPFVGFIGITIAGFLFTSHGWFFLGVSIAAFFIFSAKPQAF